MSIKKIAVFSLLLAASFQACSDSDKDKEVHCTMEFALVNVQVQDIDGNPIALDSINVLKNGKDVTLVNDFTSDAFQDMQKAGAYPIATDNMQGELLNKKVDFEFKGYINKKLVAAKTIQMTADECHIESVTEDLKVIVKDPRK